MSVREYLSTLKQHIRRSRRSFAVYSVLRLLVLLVMVRSAFAGRWESVALCVLSLALFLVPSVLERSFSLDIPPAFEIIIYSFIFAAEILGEIDHFYVRIPMWDTVLHTLNGFLAAAVGFSLVYLLNRKAQGLRLSPFFMALVAFCFSMTIGVCWEFVEYTGDTFLGQDMQKDFVITDFQSVALDPEHDQQLVPVRDVVRTTIDCADGSQVVVEGGYLDVGLNDTMKDLVVNFVGAVVFSVGGYFMVRDGDLGQGRRRRIARSVARGLIVRPHDWSADDADDASAAADGEKRDLPEPGVPGATSPAPGAAPDGASAADASGDGARS